MHRLEGNHISGSPNEPAKTGEAQKNWGSTESLYRTDGD